MKGGVGLASIMIFELRDRQGTPPPEGSSERLRQFVVKIGQYREPAHMKQEPVTYGTIMHETVGQKVWQSLAGGAKAGMLDEEDMAIATETMRGFKHLCGKHEQRKEHRFHFH